MSYLPRVVEARHIAGFIVSTRFDPIDLAADGALRKRIRESADKSQLI